jgi:hypothetical protein
MGQDQEYLLKSWYIHSKCNRWSSKNGINGVITLIQNTINSAIRAINGAINIINKIPKVSVNKIDELHFNKLAKGGIVDEPTVSLIGEAGREAVIPLENNKGWIKNLAAEIRSASINDQMPGMPYDEIVNAFKDALGQMKVELDDNEMGRFVQNTVINALA